jgi:hypothetical protein
MKSSITKRFAATAALAVLALGAAGAAHARDNVSFSIGISSPGFYGQPAPVYYPQQPVYVQPRPVYVQPAPAYYPPQTVYVQPSPVYVQPAPYGYYYDNGRDWRRVEWERRQQWQRHHHGRDWDRDGRRD